MIVTRRFRSLAAFAATLALTAAAFLAPATAAFVGSAPAEGVLTARVVLVLPRHTAPPGHGERTGNGALVR